MHELRCLDRTQLFGRRVRVIRENRGGAVEVLTLRRPFETRVINRRFLRPT